jgi:hypothetical protein
MQRKKTAMSSLLDHIHRTTPEPAPKPVDRGDGFVHNGITYRPDGDGGYRPDDAFLA